MTDEAEHFRQRAQECRRLAVLARDEMTRDYLILVADDLEAEASEIDGAEPSK